MKIVRIIPVLLFLLLAAGCEKAIYDEEETETVSQRSDNGSGDNGNDDGSDTGNDNGDGDDDGSDPLDDRKTPYEETDIVDGNGDSPNGYHTGDELTVMQFIQADVLPGVWVTGYIVGACSKKIENADFNPPFNQATAILLADDKEEKDVNKVISIQLKSGTELRNTVNLADHPDMYQRRLMVFGYRDVYLGIYGLKDVGASDWKLLE